MIGVKESSLEYQQTDYIWPLFDHYFLRHCTKTIIFEYLMPNEFLNLISFIK